MYLCIFIEHLFLINKFHSFSHKFYYMIFPYTIQTWTNKLSTLYSKQYQLCLKFRILFFAPPPPPQKMWWLCTYPKPLWLKVLKQISKSIRRKSFSNIEYMYMYISRHFAQDDNNVVLLQTKPLNSLFHENILLYHQKIMNQIFFRRGGGGN